MSHLNVITHQESLCGHVLFQVENAREMQDVGRLCHWHRGAAHYHQHRLTAAPYGNLTVPANSRRLRASKQTHTPTKIL